MTPREFARELVFAAKRDAMQKSSNCYPPGGAPPVWNQKYSGWSFSIDVYEHPGDKALLTHPPQYPKLYHYRLSAKLFPPGRSSTVEDWDALGKIVADIVSATGYPGHQRVRPILPIESIHPNSTIHWMWHDDGSDVDINVWNITAETLTVVQKQLNERAVEHGIATPPHTRKPPGRNDPCHCGSGKKYKKCHGAPN